jgi:hypothetical protein
MLYIPIYIFAIWDSYRSTIDINNNFVLAQREDSDIVPFRICSVEINYLDKRKPWVAAVWSLLSPGTGQLYLHRILVGLFLIIFWTTVVYCSRLLPALQYSLFGEFEKSRDVINWEWFLNIPSIYIFAAYDSYTNTVENNKLFDWELSKFLKVNYQNRDFYILDKSEQLRGENMYVVSTFDYTINLEKAITAIEFIGVPRGDILAVPMDKQEEKIMLFDSMNYTDKASTLDTAAILGAVFMLFGSIYGFLWKWGPVWWGVIGLFFGVSLGLFIKFLYTKKLPQMRSSPREAQVVLIIKCRDNLLDIVKDILWKHDAIGVSKLYPDNNT